MNRNLRRHIAAVAIACASATLAAPADADAITEWNARASDIVVEARLGPPLGICTLAAAHTAAFAATNAITNRFSAGDVPLAAAPGASADAAIAAAMRGVLSKFAPTQQAAIDRAYQAALAGIAEGPAKAAGIDLGERAATAVLAMRADDLAPAPDTYRPVTSPGVYVPTITVAALPWPKRKPWNMSSASQFRPGPPPALTSAVWARDYNEIKAVGGRSSKERTAEQTAVAKFWEATLPPIYQGLVRSVAERPGREITQNARLFAAAAQAQDDALIAVFDAKYHYVFWRPVTAIRNGDIDGNDATERDSSWSPLVDTPMHPEYPCAHCISAAAIGAVLKAELGNGPVGTLRTQSYLVANATRSWTSIDEIVQEVANARIYDGVHYRTSTEVGTAMGTRIGELAVAKLLRGN